MFCKHCKGNGAVEGVEVVILYTFNFLVFTHTNPIFQCSLYIFGWSGEKVAL